MKCSNCGADCSDQARTCEFCGQAFEASPPPLPDFSPPPIPGLEQDYASDNPYAASGSAYSGSPQIPYNEVPNHLALSIVSAVLSFLCCCVPFGIVPVIFSTQVNSKLAIGDYEGARSASANAKLWSWISIGVALSVFAMNMIFQFVVSSGMVF